MTVVVTSKAIDIIRVSNSYWKSLGRFHLFLLNPYRGKKSRLIEKDVWDVQQMFQLITVDGIQLFFINEMNLLRKYLTDYCVEKITEPGSTKNYFMSVVDIRRFIICKFIFQTSINLHKLKGNKQTFEKDSAPEYDCQRWSNQPLMKKWKLKASRGSLQCTDRKPINAHKSKTL